MNFGDDALQSAAVVSPVTSAYQVPAAVGNTILVAAALPAFDSVAVAP